MGLRQMTCIESYGNDDSGVACGSAAILSILQSVITDEIALACIRKARLVRQPLQ